AGNGQIGKIFGRALKLLIPVLEKRKFAATSKPPPGGKRAAHGSRHVPAHVKRAVWKRDGGQGTFVSESGHRCQARTGIEFDNVRELARGGQATVDGIRLRCRGHNQYTAEQTFGAGFMQAKREAARARAEARRSRTATVEHALGHVDSRHVRESEGDHVGEGWETAEIEVEHAPGHAETRAPRGAERLADH